jgi:hypothetical protein
MSQRGSSIQITSKAHLARRASCTRRRLDHSPPHFVWNRESLDYALRQARFWALKLGEEFDVSRDERQDDISDLLTDLCLRTKAYDPEESSQRTFIARVTLNEYHDLRKSYLVGRRARHRHTALLSDRAYNGEHSAQKETDLCLPKSPSVRNASRFDPRLTSRNSLPDVPRPATARDFCFRSISTCDPSQLGVDEDVLRLSS